MSLTANKLPRILASLCLDPWLIDGRTHEVLTDIVTAHAFGGHREEEQHAKAEIYLPKGEKSSVEVQGETAIIPMDGVLVRKFSRVLNSSGVTSTDVLEKTFREVAANDAVKSVVLYADSPGGEARGVPEAAAAMRDLVAVKPVITFTDGLLASGAYWIASQTTAIYASASADIGSIGAYVAYLDKSRMAEMIGLKVELFKAGKFKGMGFPGTQLTDEQREMIQKRIDDLGDEFKYDVVAGRAKAGRTIAPEVMQGQSFTTANAIGNGLVDAAASMERALRDAALWQSTFAR